MFINFQILNNNFNQNLLEEYIIKYFSYNKIDLFLQELMFLGFEYILNFSLNLENFKNYFYTAPLLRKFDNSKLTYLWSYSNSTINIFNFNKKSILSFKKFFELIETFNKINPITNSLYLMVTTGAKINWIQLLQLIGFRGYLSNVKGFLYEIPIMQNFNRGLNIYEYFISSFGSRKGIIDTAIKTADSGYLTRRLIETTRDIIIKEYNCGTKTNLIFKTILNIKGNIEYNLNFLEGKNFNYGLNIKKNLIYKLKNNKYPFINKNLFFINYMNLKGIYNWISGRNICNVCFGLNNNKLNNLGESIGVLSAQTIGEPGTQLTLRTFHTGGVFTNLKNNIKSKNIYIFKNFKSKLFLNYKILSLKKNYQNIKFYKKKVTFIYDIFNLKKLGIFNILKKDLKFFIKYKNLYNIKQIINLKFISTLFLNSKYNLYNYNQLLLYYPLDIILKNLTKNYISQKFNISKSYQIINHKSIYLLNKNKTNLWVIKNLNVNYIYTKILNTMILNINKKLICNFNNKYFNILKIKYGYIYKIFIYKYLKYNIIKNTFRIKFINYYKLNIYKKNINKLYVNYIGFNKLKLNYI
uniref:DNA-directed RNA polymerase n=1 Tax=Nephromyces sp. ex Molgula occidentalis TaxID=2544991 RepID=A0A5C1H831_9APIC|nr:plastid-encoded DNA-directed RNA polymerase beta''A [Nephromyces sp. ex Molgula occidentalis]